MRPRAHAATVSGRLVRRGLLRRDGGNGRVRAGRGRQPERSRSVGVVIGLSLIVLIVVPQIIGIVLGVRAHRLGEVRLGRAGIVLNAAIATYLVLSSVLQLALA